MATENPNLPAPEEQVSDAAEDVQTVTSEATPEVPETEAPAAAEAESVAEAPAAEEPVAETPATEEPVTEMPAVETPWQRILLRKHLRQKNPLRNPMLRRVRSVPVSSLLPRR